MASVDLGRNGCPVRLVQWQRMSFELHSLPLSRAKMEREHGPGGGQGCGRDRVAQRSLRIADGHEEKALEENWEDQEDRRGHGRRRCAWLQIYAGTWSRVQEPASIAVSLFPNWDHSGYSRLDLRSTPPRVCHMTMSPDSQRSSHPAVAATEAHCRRL